MTDREMLELAAKAAGIPIDRSETNGGGVGNDGFGLTGDLMLDWHNDIRWNPLRDDGDALRLAVKLLIQVVQDRMGFVKVGWSVGFDSGTPSTDGRGPWYWKEWLSDHKGDRQAATRRAIVQAAAAIGKAMP